MLFITQSYFNNILWIIILIEIVNGNEDCYEVDNIKYQISRMEYQYAKVFCYIKVSPKCRKGPLKMIWMKNNIQFDFKKKSKIKSNIKMEYKFYNVSKENSGNYTCLIRSQLFSFSGDISLKITDGPPELKIIRQNTVPEHEFQLEKNRVYWMPRMSDIVRIESVLLTGIYTFHCQFFSSVNYSTSYNTVKWFASRNPVNNSNSDTYGENVDTGPQYEISTYDYDCTLIDMWMTISSGFCYNTELKIKSVNNAVHEYYTCVIANQLNTTHQIVIENHDFDPLPYNSESIEESQTIDKQLNFTKNSTICEGEQFIFYCACATKLQGANISIIRNNSRSESLLQFSVDTVHFLLNSPQRHHSGTYLCRWPNVTEISMHLTVKTCVNYLIVKFFISFLVMILVLNILFGFFIFIRRVKQAFHLKNSNRVYVMRRIVLKEVVQNPDYISMPINSKLEIPRDRVTISGVKLGEGNFGTVFRGWVDSREVAIKIASELGQEMLSVEVQMMQEIGRHRHILELIGICFDEGCLWAIMELASRGSLKNHLQLCNPSIHQPCEEIEFDQLFVYSMQIGRGMDYLSSKSVVHRDLATRNILLFENGDIKISDFGLTRIVINYYHSMSEESRPLRWMAPESFVENKFTTKSDIWSFGIVLWEIFTLGVVPYFSLSFNEIRDAVCNGVINDKPEMAPEWIYDLMKKCWRFDEDLRPTFSEIVTQLESANYNEYI